MENIDEYALVITKDFSEKHPDTMIIINRLIRIDEELDKQKIDLRSEKSKYTNYIHTII